MYEKKDSGDIGTELLESLNRLKIQEKSQEDTLSTTSTQSDEATKPQTSDETF